MKVTLRPVEPRDLDAIFADQADPESAAMAVVPARDRGEFDAHWARTDAEPGVLKRTILVDGEYAGLALSFVRGGRREVGYRITRRSWGRGVATAALGALLSEIDERPLFAHVAAHNPASRRVVEKHGFARVRDEVQDGVTFAVLRLD